MVLDTVRIRVLMCLFLLAALNILAIAQNPGTHESPSKNDIPALIDQLPGVANGDVGYSSTMSGSSFLPIGTSEPGALLLGQRPMTTSGALRDIVERGAAAVPYLIAHLDDKRATRITINHENAFGEMFFTDEYDYNRVTSQRPEGVNRELALVLHQPQSHTITVGDLCFVALGQIVNRSFNAVRYQPTLCIMINSPTDSEPLRAAVKKEWGNLTPEQHKQSLVRDFLQPDFEERRIEACLRLGYYYPDEFEPLVLKQLSTKREDAPHVLPIENAEQARFIDALEFFPSPRIDQAVRRVLRSTEDDYLSTACVNYLIGRGADADIREYVHRYSPGANASRRAELNALLDRLGWTPLHLAVEKYQADRAASLVRQGANVNARAASGQTPLHLAAGRGDAGAVHALLAWGANPSLKDSRGMTAMQLAARVGSEEAVKSLMLGGATVTDVLAASLAGRADLVAQCLAENPGSVNMRTSEGETSLHPAARLGYTEIVRVLLEHGADVNARDSSKLTPLHRAASYGKSEVVKLLLKYHADRHARMWDGKTPLNLARESNDKTTIRLLQQ